MYSLIRKSAVVLLSILILLPPSSTIAGPKDKPPKDKPLRLMDSGVFMFFPGGTSAALVGRGLSTHMGKIASAGTFFNLGNSPIPQPSPRQPVQMASTVVLRERLLLLMETSSSTSLWQSSALTPMLRVSSTA